MSQSQSQIAKQDQYSNLLVFFKAHVEHMGEKTDHHTSVNQSSINQKVKDQHKMHQN